jgi:hypothetical protein
MGKHEKLSGRERSARYREKMRAKGYRLKQFWLPDVTSPEFIAQAEADSRAIAASEDSREVQAWLDSIRDEDWSTWADYGASRGDAD